MTLCKITLINSRSHFMILALNQFTTLHYNIQGKMSTYRSETVQKFKLYLPRQTAWYTMNKLGQDELVHIVPSKNHELSKTFASHLKRIQQTMQKINTLINCITRCGLSTSKVYVYSSNKIVEIFELYNSLSKQHSCQSGANQLNICIDDVNQLWQYYVQISKRIQIIQGQIISSRQNIAILLAGEKQYGKAFFCNQKQRVDSFHKNNSVSLSRINYKTGVIKISDQLRFKRTIFRISKGNCLIVTKKFDDLFSVLQNNEKQKSVFFIVYPASKETYFDKKIIKLIGTFSDKQFDYSCFRRRSFQEILKEHRSNLSEAISLKKMCENQLQTFFSQRLLEDVKYQSLQSLKKYQYFKFYLIKEKQIYQNLNQMQIYNHFLQGEIFVRKQNVKRVQQVLAIHDMKKQLPSGNILPIFSHQKYPTSFILNDFTRPAQQIVETYGVPRYKEINPGIFTNITFPFLFGVMFGDIGHGLIVLGLGGFLILKEQQFKKQQGSVLSILMPYRYLITLMGFFATFCGFIYNDFLSISLNLFNSCYLVENTIQGEVIEKISSQCNYTLGVDPVWSVASNSLNFINSLKMKISVIIGVLHMTLGVILRGLNDLFFRNYKQFIFVFITQIIFLLIFFGYMDFLIIYKWLTEWGTQRDPGLAPSIISQMIAIPLLMGSTEGKALWDQLNQENLQYLILVIGVLCVPLMLFPVPLMKIFMMKKKSLKDHVKKIMRANDSRRQSDIQRDMRQVLLEKQQDNNKNQQQQVIMEAEEFHQQSCSQIFVHQIIQTIEYVLGCVSNTASYLRLWALSLAHSQLSEVFFEKTVQQSLQDGWSGIIMNIFGFGFLALITVGIMLLMDSMECFLHTLRLHWVEFQNKFFRGDGFRFKNYNFKDRINEELRKNIQ